MSLKAGWLSNLSLWPAPSYHLHKHTHNSSGSSWCSFSAILPRTLSYCLQPCLCDSLLITCLTDWHHLVQLRKVKILEDVLVLCHLISKFSCLSHFVSSVSLIYFSSIGTALHLHSLWRRLDLHHLCWTDSISIPILSFSVHRVVPIILFT